MSDSKSIVRARAKRRGLKSRKRRSSIPRGTKPNSLDRIAAEAARQVAYCIGAGLLSSINQDLRELCPKPFDEQGKLTDDGADAVLDIAQTWIGDFLVDDDLTEKVLSHF